ncbi:hypothetical protein JQ603_15895 [Bradyrhizobium liaoningense]|nr:hypothetical protein [Bradyrhizobium liaoningense]
MPNGLRGSFPSATFQRQDVLLDRQRHLVRHESGGRRHTPDIDSEVGRETRCASAGGHLCRRPHADIGTRRWECNCHRLWKQLLFKILTASSVASALGNDFLQLAYSVD